MTSPPAGRRDGPPQVTARIREAFAAERYPGDDRLVDPTAWRDREREQITRDFAGQSWRELGVEFLRCQPEAILLMSPAAFRFYLPAYLLAAVEDPRGSDLVPAAVVHSLTPDRDAAGAGWFAERVDGLSADQQAAVIDALRLIGESGLFLEREAQRAVDYWTSRTT